MIRHLSCTLIVCSLTGSSFAQSALRTFQRIPGPVKDAGVLHVATGTWTRHAGGGLLAPGASSIVFNNTVPSGYYYPQDPGQVTIDEGRLPSPTSPGRVWNPVAVPEGSQPGSAQGCQTSYQIDGFQVAYCSDAPGATTALTLSFYDQYATAGACTGPPIGPATASLVLTNLPGRPIPPLACWVITLDLTGSPSSFPLMADGDGSYSNGTADLFGWSFTFPSITSTASQTGMFIAGCPSDGNGPVHPGFGWNEGGPATMEEAAGYDGTRFDGPPGAPPPVWPSNTSERGTGMDARDQFRDEGIGPFSGCHFFGGPIGTALGGPFASFHLRMYSAVSCPPCVCNSFEYCAGDGIDPLVTTACPCFNFGAPGNGCRNSTNSAGAHLAAAGSVALDNVVLYGTGMPPTSGAIYLKGDQDAGAGIVFGDGVRCANGNLIRMKNKQNVNGASQFPEPGDPTLSSRGQTPVGSSLTGYYSVYYRNAAGFCTPATFNASNGGKVTW